ncbi:MAG: ribonucleotide-diphosphate reductase subunit beta [Sphingobacteriales bacterium]|nr:ribonucleotide-diphosphate reductase subunit beta [Sphingobacteriales bacterium]
MSNLIHINGIPTFKNKNGFRYPEFWEHYKQHDRLHWTAEQISLAKDIQDFEKASDKEKEDITRTMRLFTQNEVQVGYGYATMLRIFKPIEVQAMLSNFMAREFTHIENYSLFTETIGLPNSIYQEFLDIPVMSTKAEYLEKAKVRKYEEYKALNLSDSQLDKVFRRDIARMLAVYAGGTEAISLMAQFAALLKYQFDGKYPGLCQIVEYSIREETLHFVYNSHLFRVFIAENQDIWDDELKYDIYQGIREIVAYEEALVDYFDYAHISNSDLKRYIEYRGDIALKELGMKPNWNTTVNPLGYMDDVVGTILTDFFSGRVTQYSKAIEGDWGDISYEKWK